MLCKTIHIQELGKELSRSEKAREEVSEEYSQYRLRAQQWQVRKLWLVWRGG